MQTSYPGATHHGKPMEVIPLGATYLPIEVILEYLESLKEIYTMEVGFPSLDKKVRMKAELNGFSHMTCFSTIATTSPTISQCF